MNVTVPIPVGVVQTVVDAAAITSGSRVLFQCDENQLTIHLTSNARICSMYLVHTYDREINIDTSLRVGVHVSALSTFSKICSTPGVVTTTFNRSDAKVHFTKDNLKLHSRLIDPGEIPLRTIERSTILSGQIATSGSLLNAVITLADQLSERVSLILHPEQPALIIKARGDSDRVEFHCDDNSVRDFTRLPPDSVTTELIAKYIVPLQATIPDTATVVYEFDSGTALRVSYTLPHTETEVMFSVPPILK